MEWAPVGPFTIVKCRQRYSLTKPFNLDLKFKFKFVKFQNDFERLIQQSNVFISKCLVVQMVVIQMSQFIVSDVSLLKSLKLLKGFIFLSSSFQDLFKAAERDINQRLQHPIQQYKISG